MKKRNLFIIIALGLIISFISFQVGKHSFMIPMFNGSTPTDAQQKYVIAARQFIGEDIDEDSIRNVKVRECIIVVFKMDTLNKTAEIMVDKNSGVPFQGSW